MRVSTYRPGRNTRYDPPSRTSVASIILPPTVPLGGVDPYVGITMQRNSCRYMWNYFDDLHCSLLRPKQGENETLILKSTYQLCNLSNNETI